MNTKQIRSLCNKPLWITLNSGRVINVMPSVAYGEIENGEVDGNDKLAKLQADGLIVINDDKGKSSGVTEVKATEEVEPSPDKAKAKSTTASSSKSKS